MPKNVPKLMKVPYNDMTLGRNFGIWSKVNPAIAVVAKIKPMFLIALNPYDIEKAGTKIIATTNKLIDTPAITPTVFLLDKISSRPASIPVIADIIELKSIVREPVAVVIEN